MQRQRLEELKRLAGVPKRVIAPPAVDDVLKGKVKELAYQKIKEAVRLESKGERHDRIDAVAVEAKDALAADYEGRSKEIATE